MADEDLTQDAQDEKAFHLPRTPGLNRLVQILIYLALGMLGILLMSVIAYYVARKAASQQYKETASIALVKPPPPTENFNFSEEFRVNTADEDETHFIKLKLSIGFKPGNPALSGEIAQRVPQLRNIINLILMRKKKNELSSIESRLDLQEELKASINHILSNGKITDIYFSELIIN